MNTKPKLSPAQVRVLKVLAEPRVVAHFVAGLDAYWFLSGSGKRVRFETMERLISHGFLGITRDTIGDYDKAYILPAGWAYLEKGDQDERR